MRVTRIHGDHNDIGEKPCRVWCNEVEIHDWIVADDFRRVVIVPSTEYQFLEEDAPRCAPERVFHGAVRIEMIQGASIPDGAVIEIDGQVVEREEHPAAPAPVKSSIHIPARKRKASR